MESDLPGSQDRHGCFSVTGPKRVDELHTGTEQVRGALVSHL